MSMDFEARSHMVESSRPLSAPLSQEVLLEESPLPEGTMALHAPPGFLPWVAHLVHRHRSRLLSFSRRRGLDPEDSLDVVQDAFVSFLRLERSRSIAESDEDALRLLYVLVRHNVLNHKRKAKRRRAKDPMVHAEVAPLGLPSSETLIAQAEELGRIRGCILRMAQLQRRVVSLSLLDETPHDEVARVLGIKPSHVRVLLHRARLHLKTCSDDSWEENEDFDEDPS